MKIFRPESLKRSRYPDPRTLESEVTAWLEQRNASGARIWWMFDVERARQKMGRLYPTPAVELPAAA